MVTDFVYNIVAHGQINDPATPYFQPPAMCGRESNKDKEENFPNMEKGIYHLIGSSYVPYGQTVRFGTLARRQTLILDGYLVSRKDICHLLRRRRAGQRHKWTSSACRPLREERLKARKRFHAARLYESVHISNAFWCAGKFAKKYLNSRQHWWSYHCWDP